MRYNMRMEKPDKDFTRLIRADRLKVDPLRFQFRTGANGQGDCGRLEGVDTWVPEYAGVCIVYRDWWGDEWIVDGHHRRALAMRLQKRTGRRISLRCRVYEEARGVTAEEVRIRAALKNLAEGHADALDIAKLLRNGLDLDDLRGKVPSRSAAMIDGKALAGLGGVAWSILMQSDIDPSHAAEIARTFPDNKSRQYAAMIVLRNNPQASKTAARLLIQQLRTAKLKPHDEGALFDLGGLFAEDLLSIKTRILEAALTRLKSERAAFGNAVRNENKLSEAGNVLAADVNRRHREIAGRLATTLAAQASYAGPVADMLTDAARAVAEGGDEAEAVDRFLTAVVRHEVQLAPLNAA